jgi:sarcosine oxidase, subunit gamma
MSAATPRFATRRAVSVPTQVSLRADPADAALVAALGAAAAVALPLRVGAVAKGGARVSMALGPDEWLIVSDIEGEAPALVAALAAAAAGRHATAVDVSAARVAVLLEGPGAADLIAAGCPLDLGPAAFPPGAVAGTVLAGTTVLIERRAAESWRVFVRRSYAGHVDAWLGAVAADIEAMP